MTFRPERAHEVDDGMSVCFALALTRKADTPAVRAAAETLQTNAIACLFIGLVKPHGSTLVMKLQSWEKVMPIERETVVHHQPAETVVVERGSPFRIVGFIIAAVIAVLLILWLASGGISSNGDAINIDLPNVTVSN